jgi:hypothetical protein
MGLYGSNRTYLNLENYDLQEGFLPNSQSVLAGNHVLDALYSDTDGFLQQIHVFFQLNWIGLFGTQWPIFHFETFDLQEVFLSKTNSVLTRKQSTSAPATNIDGFPCRDTCVSTTLLNGPICMKMCLSPPWKYDLQKVFLSKLCELSQGNNEVYSVVSNLDSFTWRDTCVPIWNKMSLSPTWKLWFPRLFPFKN